MVANVLKPSAHVNHLTENTPGQVVPGEPERDRAALQGEQLFSQIGCNSCHAPALVQNAASTRSYSGSCGLGVDQEDRRGLEGDLHPCADVQRQFLVRATGHAPRKRFAMGAGARWPVTSEMTASLIR